MVSSLLRGVAFAAVAATLLGCSSDSEPAIATTEGDDTTDRCDLDENGECTDWRAVATTRGFETDPKDFYEFLSFACFVEPAEIPTTIAELGSLADLVALGRVSDVVVDYSYANGIDPYSVQLELSFDEVIKGARDTTRVRLLAPCAHGAKVEGLRNSMPSQPALFVLHDSSDEGTSFDFSSYYFGIVVEHDHELSFPLLRGSQEVTPPSLEGYSTLEQLAAAL